MEIGCRDRRGPWFTAYKPTLAVPLAGYLFDHAPTGWLFTIGCRWLVVGVGWQSVLVRRRESRIG